jgi:hypothetical protein
MEVATLPAARALAVPVTTNQKKATKKHEKAQKVIANYSYPFS